MTGKPTAPRKRKDGAGSVSEDLDLREPAEPSVWEKSKKQLLAGLAGVIIATIVALFKDSIGETIQSVSAFLRGDDRIFALEEELRQAKNVDSSFIAAPNLSRDDCYKMLHGFAKSQGWQVSRPYSQTFSLDVSVDGTLVGLRCVASNWSDTTFIVVFAPASFREALDKTYAALEGLLSSRAIGLNLFEPFDAEWINFGPYITEFYFIIELSRVDFEAWRFRNELPKAISDAFGGPGSKFYCSNETYPSSCTFWYPRHNVSFLQPTDELPVKVGLPVNHPSFLAEYLACHELGQASGAELPALDENTSEKPSSTETVTVVEAPMTSCDGTPVNSDAIPVPIVGKLAYMQFGVKGPYDPKGILFGDLVEQKVLTISSVDRRFGVVRLFQNWD